MGYIIPIKSRQQYIDAIRVLEKLPGTWQSRGPSSAPVLLVLESHYMELVKAGVVPENGQEGKARGKKATAKKVKS